ncbi:MAG: hypothetical protein ACJ74U_09035 [Jatrophihabitantaceae bacterium]
MSETQQRGPFLGFVTTIPGILTAIAAVVTAAGGIYLGGAQGQFAAAGNDCFDESDQQQQQRATKPGAGR